MKRDQQLLRLRPLIDAEFRARQGTMTELKRKEQDLKQRLLDLSGRHAVTDVGAQVDPATLAGADLRWNAWAETRRTEINQKIARLRVDQDKAKTGLRRTFGRKLAIDALCKSIDEPRQR